MIRVLLIFQWEVHKTEENYFIVYKYYPRGFESTVESIFLLKIGKNSFIKNILSIHLLTVLMNKLFKIIILASLKLDYFWNRIRIHIYE